MRKALFILACIVLCMGQTCAEPMPAPPSSQGIPQQSNTDYNSSDQSGLDQVGQESTVVDQCPDDPEKDAPGICGCGISDIDGDSDGTADCLDQCPLDPTKIEPGLCGCGSSDQDTDGDGAPDCLDICPADPLKTVFSVCPCGIPDTDLDQDGFPDLCMDNCPLTYNPSQLDSDLDGLGDACDSTPYPIPLGTILVAYDGQFLGNINDNSFDPDSLANPYGTYGNSYSTLSIWNPFGTYGSNYGIYSPWNSFAINPPVIIEDGVVIGYLTTNTSKLNAIHPNNLALLLGRTDAIR